MESGLLERGATLFPAVVSDILDQLGYRNQVMAPRIRPLYPQARLVGWARTVRAEPVQGPPERPQDNYRMQIAAIESMRPGNVMVVSQIETCMWGELLSLGARQQGAHGIVIDGYTRDCEGVIGLKFPTFSAGIHVADALGRVEVKEYGGEIRCGEVTVRDGDLIIGNYDGVVAVPAEVAEEVVRRAEEKVSGENLVRAELCEGMSISQVYAKYGIL